MAIVASFVSAAEPRTERHYLSGHGPEDAVPWEFSVTGGRRAGEAAKIPVPSHWELHGFGTYNYGQEQDKGDEHGRYRTSFRVPADWQDRRIWLVFDGVMTDADVKVNGRSAGPVHQGGFTRFRYDVTGLLKPDADNVLEVDVAKVSANADTERAERSGDYWVFGGIYRPVWLEAVPRFSIEHVAINALADGTLTADVMMTAPPDHVGPERETPDHAPERLHAQVFDSEGQPFGRPFGLALPGGGAGRVRLATQFEAPRLWTAETPHLYTMRVTRFRGDEELHVVDRRFGFRTFEVRQGEGLFLNGRRILLKGVNRHSFRPDTGRSLTREDCYADVRLIQSMNMNAVRMSHYPPDEAFLEACDELGLYVLDELSGWQHPHDTVVGRLLVREMVERDVNHPSILFWDNGNERGWNRDLDGEFALHDPRQRPVLHPSHVFSGLDTKHYTAFSDHARRLQGPNLVMPTEILHAMFDGGAGSGLEDYWGAIRDSRFGAGAFIWMLADEGIVRTDEGGRVDVFSTFAADGILGPRHEREGSYYTIRDVWSPVQIEPPRIDADFDGTLVVHNRYDFTSLSQCRFEWQLARLAGMGPAIVARGAAAAPEVAPGETGRLRLSLPADWREADVLYLTATDHRGMELWRWSWATPALDERTRALPQKPGVAARIETAGNEIRLIAGATTATIDAGNGLLVAVSHGNRKLALGNGPRLAFARPASSGEVTWHEWQAGAELRADGIRRLAVPQMANLIEIQFENLRGVPFGGFKLELSSDGTAWKTVFDGTRRPGDGTRYEFPPQPVKAVRISNVLRSDGKPGELRVVRLGWTPARFPNVAPGLAVVTSGTEPGKDGTVAWVEARGAGGLERHRWSLSAAGLQLDYAYELQGEMVYHGITFDHPEEQMKGLRWLGEGPYRVWQNRLRGTWLGIHETVRHAQQPGTTWHYPEFDGIFAGVRWATLDTDAGPVTMTALTPGSYLRVGTPRITHFQTTVDFPSGDVSWLHAIPGMGSKFRIPEVSGPAAQARKADGRYEGRIRFSVE